MALSQEAGVTRGRGQGQEGCPISSHTFTRFNNISNILRYLYVKPMHNNGNMALSRSQEAGVTRGRGQGQ